MQDKLSPIDIQAYQLIDEEAGYAAVLCITAFTYNPNGKFYRYFQHRFDEHFWAMAEANKMEQPNEKVHIKSVQHKNTGKRMSTRSRSVADKESTAHASKRKPSRKRVLPANPTSSVSKGRKCKVK